MINNFVAVAPQLLILAGAIFLGWGLLAWIADLPALRDRMGADHDEPGEVGRVDYDPRKRLSDAECAAEMWKASAEAGRQRHRVDMGSSSGPGMSADEAEDLERVMARFAALPHFDEERVVVDG